MTGYYLMHRGWRDNPVFQDEPCSEREAWVWLIEEAAYQDRRQRVGKVIVSVKRGQLAVSTRFLAEAWQWSHSKARRFLERLEKEGMIGTDADTGVSVITICNYETYQAPGSASGTPTNTAAAQRRHSSGTKQKKGNEVNSTSPSANAKGEDPPAADGDEEPALITLGKAEPASLDTMKAMAVIWRDVCGDVLPVPRGLDKGRLSALRNRYSDTFGRSLDRWREFCERVRGSPFLTGENERGWRADLDFMLKPKNANKLLEGGYDDRKKSSSDQLQPLRPSAGQPSPHMSLFEAAAAVDARLRKKELAD
ncbi:hypothetical protein [Azospirillum aestuarii]|uniref:hypothetical protein n=1 Tax=Azospirillum aestuarii TaxID=2802052 RepID=UPI004054AB12